MKIKRFLAFLMIIPVIMTMYLGEAKSKPTEPSLSKVKTQVEDTERSQELRIKRRILMISRGGDERESSPESNSIPSETVEKTETEGVPKYNILLSNDLAVFTYNLCKENGFEYELILSVMWNESGMDPNNSGKNSNGTIDRGLMSINSAYGVKEAKAAGIENFNYFDAKQNIQVGIYILKEKRDIYAAKGITGKALINCMLGSYNKGIGGFAKYLRRGCKTPYAKKILQSYIELKTTKTLT